MSKTDQETKVRQSSRTKKFSVAFQSVDEETRKLVMKNRLDALENDHLFDELNYGTSAFPEDENEGSEQDWKSEKASESEDIVSDADSV